MLFASGSKRQGLGHDLLSAAEASVTKLGVKSITLKSTKTAICFYEKHGYNLVGSTPGCLNYEKQIKP